MQIVQFGETGKSLFLIEGTLAQILQFWSQTTSCEAVQVVANKQDVSRFNAELKGLEKQGFVEQDENGQWQIRPQVFLEFLKENANQELCRQ
jgi:DNA-binding IclR family transcriptional regulator